MRQPAQKAPVRQTDSAEHRRLLAERANLGLPRTGAEPMEGPLILKEYAKANLTAALAADYPFAWVYVTDEVGGAVPAFSDGTNWRRCTDRAIVA